MDTCAVETGLLSKKPCGQPAATHCATCEMGLCSKHAVPQLAEGKKTGKFRCKECDAARKAIDRTDALKKKQLAAAPAAKPAAREAPKPAAPQTKDEPSGGIDFTPTKK